MNTPRTSVSFLAMSAMSLVLGLALGVLPQVADAAEPNHPKSKGQPPEASKPAAKPNPKPKASKTTRTLDATAARALRSTSRERDEALRGERVAMRTAPAADGPPPKRRKSKKKATKRDDEDARAPGSDADRKISLDEDFLVEGKLEKPNAFFILRRSQSGYDWARLDAKFLPLVLESVQDPLF